MKAQPAPGIPIPETAADHSCGKTNSNPEIHSIREVCEICGLNLPSLVLERGETEVPHRPYGKKSSLSDSRPVRSHTRTCSGCPSLDQVIIRDSCITRYTERNRLACYAETFVGLRLDR